MGKAVTQPELNRKPDILVTGGGGFLGSAIVRQLVDQGHSVCSFSRAFHPGIDLPGVHQIQGDIADPQAVETAVKGMDLVFHVAARPGVWGRYSDYYQTNVIGTRNVVRACRLHKVPRLVYTSSPSVVFNGRNMEGVDESTPYPRHYRAWYPETKALAEQEVLGGTDRYLKTVILRPHLIWGPGDNHLVPRIIERAGRLVRVGNGRNLVDTVYIDNAARAHVLAGEKLNSTPQISGNVYFIAQGQPIPLWDLIDGILAAAGCQPVKYSIPQPMAFAVGFVLELVYKVFKLKGEPPMTRFVAEELATSHWFDLSAAEKDLGYRATISVDEGLKRLETWLRKSAVR